MDLTPKQQKASEGSEPKVDAVKNVIQTILDERNAVTKPSKVNDEMPKIFNSEDFFLDNCPFGIMWKESFRLLMDTSKESEIKEFEILLEKMNDNESFEFNSVPYGNGPVKKIYAFVGGWRGREKFAILAVDNMHKFLVAYIKLHFDCNFSLQELYDLSKIK